MPVPPPTTATTPPALAGDWMHEGVARQVLLPLQPPGWILPPRDGAGDPPVVVGFDHTGPGDAAAVPPAEWAAGLAADDPFARLLAGWGAQGSGDLWFG